MKIKYFLSIIAILSVNLCTVSAASSDNPWIFSTLNEKLITHNFTSKDMDSTLKELYSAVKGRRSAQDATFETAVLELESNIALANELEKSYLKQLKKTPNPQMQSWVDALIPDIRNAARSRFIRSMKEQLNKNTQFGTPAIMKRLEEERLACINEEKGSELFRIDMMIVGDYNNGSLSERQKTISELKKYRKTMKFSNPAQILLVSLLAEYYTNYDMRNFDEAYKLFAEMEKNNQFNDEEKLLFYESFLRFLDLSLLPDRHSINLFSILLFKKYYQSETFAKILQLEGLNNAKRTKYRELYIEALSYFDTEKALNEYSNLQAERKGQTVMIPWATIANLKIYEKTRQLGQLLPVLKNNLKTVLPEKKSVVEEYRKLLLEEAWLLGVLEQESVFNMTLKSEKEFLKEKFNIEIFAVNMQNAYNCGNDKNIFMNHDKFPLPLGEFKYQMAAIKLFQQEIPGVWKNNTEIKLNMD